MTRYRGGILLVGQDAKMRELFEIQFRHAGFLVGTADFADEALSKAAEASWDVCFIQGPADQAVELCARLKQVNSQIIVIIMPNNSSSAPVLPLESSADFIRLRGPGEPGLALQVVEHAMFARKLQQENARLREVLHAALQLPEIIGNTKEIRQARHAIGMVGPSDTNVLIQGEPGTGKELVARAIHAESQRSGAFTVVNFTSIQPLTINRELFGHESSGDRIRKGLLEAAHEGTIFFHEIGDAPVDTQLKIFDVLKKKKFLRVGGEHPVEMDLRCVAASSADLRRKMSEGNFLPDLFFLLSAVQINLPPLREREEDIALLVNHFVEMFSRKTRNGRPGVSAQTIGRLQRYAWPGNVRELKNAVERAILSSNEPEIRARDFVALERLAHLRDARLETIERAHILSVLEECADNRTRAAALLGIDRVTLYNKLKQYGLGKPRRSASA